MQTAWYRTDSRFVGDVFGAPLAMEGILAFSSSRPSFISLTVLYGALAVIELRILLTAIRAGPSDTELLEALEVVSLQEWFGALPRGWDTQLGEHGALVSGGERTRLGVARAPLSRAPVLLLDEPTEGLDPVAADELLHRLISQNHERSLLIVTHRLGPMEGVDQVLTLRNGRLLPLGFPRPPPGSVAQPVTQAA